MQSHIAEKVEPKKSSAHFELFTPNRRKRLLSLAKEFRIIHEKMFVNLEEQMTFLIQAFLDEGFEEKEARKHTVSILKAFRDGKDIDNLKLILQKITRIQSKRYHLPEVAVNILEQLKKIFTKHDQQLDQWILSHNPICPTFLECLIANLKDSAQPDSHPPTKSQVHSLELFYQASTARKKNESSIPSAPFEKKVDGLFNAPLTTKSDIDIRQDDEHKKPISSFSALLMSKIDKEASSSNVPPPSQEKTDPSRITPISEVKLAISEEKSEVKNGEEEKPLHRLREISPKEKKTFGDNQLKPLNTRGGGDCAFHAILGRWDAKAGQIVCPNVEKRRAEVVAAIREKKDDEQLMKGILVGIRELVMSDEPAGKEMSLLQQRYHSFCEQQKLAAPLIWNSLAEQIKKYPDILVHLNKQTRYLKNQTLQQQFYHALNLNKETLHQLMQEKSALWEAYNIYKATYNPEFDWEGSMTPKIIFEYADYFEKNWLRPCELYIIAIEFKKRVKYYPFPGANFDVFNPSQDSDVVSVQFNGRDHYEQLGQIDQQKLNEKKVRDIKIETSGYAFFDPNPDASNSPDSPSSADIVKQIYQLTLNSSS